MEFVDCVFQPLEVPAQAEIVLEGTVDPNERFPEGPFGDHTGCCTPVEPFPVSLLTALTRRSEAIYPPMEDVRMGRVTERLLLPLIRLFLFEIVDIHTPAEGMFHTLVVVSIEKRYPAQARWVIHFLWGLEPGHGHLPGPGRPARPRPVQPPHWWQDRPGCGGQAA